MTGDHYGSMGRAALDALDGENDEMLVALVAVVSDADLAELRSVGLLLHEYAGAEGRRRARAHHPAAG